MGQWYFTLNELGGYVLTFIQLVCVSITAFQRTLLLWMDARESVSLNHAKIPLAQAARSSRIKLIFISLKANGIPLPSQFLMDRS